MEAKSEQRALKLYFLAILSLALMGSKLSCGGNQAASNPPNGNTVFEFEYDYMIGCNLFTNGDTYLRNPFSTCNTDLDIAYNDQNLPASSILWNLLVTYMTDHAEKWLGGGEVDFIYNAYNVGILNVTNKPSGNNIDELAFTFKLRDTITNEIYMFSSILVQPIQNYGGNVQALLQKVVIHELGHSRSRDGFTHSCHWDAGTSAYVVDPNHDDPGCVMGMGRINQCNQIDITVDPHFCPADCERLKKVTW